MTGRGPGAAAPGMSPSRSVEFRALTSRTGQVRRITAAYLRYWGLGSLAETAAGAVTGLLAHAATQTEADGDCTVKVDLVPGRLTLSVRVRGDGVGVPGPTTGERETGPVSGLAQVAAVSESWGTGAPADGPGTVVWCALPADAGSGTYAADGTPRTQPALLG
jgi:hypothetical protein